MATASINAGNKSLSVSTTLAGQTVKQTYSLSQLSLEQTTLGTLSTLDIYFQTNKIFTFSDIPGTLGSSNTFTGAATVSAAAAALEPLVGASGSGGGSVAPAFSIGDMKSAWRTDDHDGWILLNGRLKSTLTPSQIIAANTLFIGANVPNGANCVIGQPLIGTIPGVVSGSNILTQANLPNVALSVSSVSAGIPSGTVSGAISQGTTFPATGTTNAGQPGLIYRSLIGAGNTVAATDAGGSGNEPNIVSSPENHFHNFSGSSLPVHNHVVSLGGADVPFVAQRIFAYHFVFLGL